MKKLSRDEMKNVIGGLNELLDCSKDSDCGNKIMSCGGNSVTGIGDCVGGRCKWVAVC
jgi:bacteriocin-like protein